MSKPMNAELVANFWPVVDSTSGLIQRVLARAYLVAGGDEVVSATLLSLAPQDYVLATPFRIPVRFVIQTDFGSLEGCVSVEQYQQYEFQIIEPVLQQLETQFAKLQGINMQSPQPLGVGQIPRFPQDPYVITTFLLESAEGHLIPQIKRR
jgi:hypothetical protein